MGCKGSTISGPQVAELRASEPPRKAESTKTSLDAATQATYKRRVAIQQAREEDDLVYDLDKPETKEHWRLAKLKQHPSHPVLKFKHSFGSGRAVSQKSSPTRRQSDFAANRFSSKEVALPKSKFGSPPTVSLVGDDVRSSMKQIAVRADLQTHNPAKPEPLVVRPRQQSYESKKILESRKRLLEEGKPLPVKRVFEAESPDKMGSLSMSKIEQPQEAGEGLKRVTHHFAIRQPSESKIKVLNGSLMSLTKGRYPTAHRRRSSLDASVNEGTGSGKNKEFRLLKEGRICKQNSSELVRSQKNEISRDSPDFSVFRTDDLRRRVLQSAQDPLLASMKANHKCRVEIGQKFQKDGRVEGQYQHVQKHKPPIKHSTDSLPDSYEVGFHPKVQGSSEIQNHLKNGYAKLRTATAEGLVKQKVVMMFPLVVKKQKKKKQQPYNQIEQQSEPQQTRMPAGEGTSPKQYSQTTKTTEVFKNSGGRFAHWVQSDGFNEKMSSNGAEALQFECSPTSVGNKVRFAIAINGQLDCWKDIPILKKDNELLSRIETQYGKSTVVASRNWHDQSQSREGHRMPYHSDLHAEKGQLETI